jgi:uncharacterized heparinase superfamily protein
MPIAPPSRRRQLNGWSRAARLLRTVRYLKPVQIYGRALARVPVWGSVSTLAPAMRPRRGTWVQPIARRACLKDRWRVEFLNRPGEIAHSGQWNDPGQPKLWTYNLHYFDDLAAGAGAEHRSMQRELIARWIAENPAGTGNGWEPYPTSLRIVNWIKWALWGEALAAPWRASLAQQARWLDRRIEWHLLGNHLLANAKALTFAGLFFEGPEAEAWLARGLSILGQELGEQVLDDGAHFELSPMYHAIILEDLLDLHNLAQTYGVPERPPMDRLPGVLSRMRAWLAAMTHPDGDTSFFNDSAFAIAPRRASLEAYALRLGLAPHRTLAAIEHLRASGYVRADRGDAALITDVAAIGPDYLPGHAHADTLSFEWSLGRERIVVNGGTSTYEAGELRARQRATAAHSTVEIDGADSSEVWSSFRVARRARVAGVSVSNGPGAVLVQASHDGYKRLSGTPTHRRTWRLEDHRLEVADWVESTAAHTCIARFHLAPGVRVMIASNGCEGSLRTGEGRSISWCTSEAAQLAADSWHPEFNRSVPSMTLAVPFSGTCRTRFEWAP